MFYLFWNRICFNFEVLTEIEMKKIVYKIFGNPIVPANTGLVGSTDGRLFIDKAVFFARKDVQAVIKSVKESKAIKEQIEKSKKGFAKMKCKELLEVVAKKAKIRDEDGDVYEQPKGFYCNGELYETWVDKDSILNAVNLDEFIK